MFLQRKKANYTKIIPGTPSYLENWKMYRNSIIQPIFTEYIYVIFMYFQHKLYSMLQTTNLANTYLINAYPLSLNTRISCIEP